MLLARHLARSPANWHMRHLVLLDSLAALGAAMKGRSPSHPILRCCRILCAVHLVTGLRLIGRRTPSEHNMVDGTSRGGPVGLALETALKADIEAREGNFTGGTPSPSSSSC